ncbi:MAG TPA: lipase family protein [Terriglobia bacterium]|nr:lipase family protein [Terriglobia bacterium]
MIAPLPSKVWDRARDLAKGKGLSYSEAWHQAYDEWRHEPGATGLLSGAAAWAIYGPLFSSRLGPKESKAHVNDEDLTLALNGDEFDHRLAAYLAVQAVLAYRSVPEIQEYVHTERGENFEHFGDRTAFGYTRAGHAFLVFRGTESFRDWVTDLNFIPWFPLPLRHRGFCKEWKRVECGVIRWVNGLPTDSPQLVMTGHSLGGALTVLAAFKLAEEFAVRRVITFGQPRVGLFHFRHCYNLQSCGPGKTETLHEVTRRYIHATDLVSRVPPPMPYCHVGSRWFLDGAGKCAQGRAKSFVERLEESYYDLKLKWILWPTKVKAKQEKLLVGWDDARKRLASQKPSVAEEAQPAPRVESHTGSGSVVTSGMGRWEAFLSGVARLLMTVGFSPVYALSVVGAILTAVVGWSYWRDAESHFMDNYVKAFHREHPRYAPQSALTYIEECKRKHGRVPPPWKSTALGSQ